MKTLLEIVQEACKRVGQPVPTAVVSSNEQTPKRLLSLLNEAGKSLLKDHDWNALTTVVTATGVAAQAQTGNPPSDYDRFTSQTSIWDARLRQPLIGPLPMNKWLNVLVMNTSGMTKYWTMISGLINISPTPAVTDSFKYSYQSKNWVQSAAPVTGKSEFSVDTDTPLISDELLIRELVWRWQQAIGMDYAEDMASAARYKETVIAADRGPMMLNLSRVYDDLPENIWPGVIG